MFWGIRLVNNKAYKKAGKKPFQITSAVLDLSTADNEIVQVGAKIHDTNFVICNLSKENGPYQVPLDLKFDEMDKVTLFKAGGKGTVHLVGYELDEVEDFDLDEEEEEENEELEDIPVCTPLNKRRKEFEESSAKKKRKLSKINEEAKPKETVVSSKKTLTPKHAPIQTSKENKKPEPSPQKVDKKESKPKQDKNKGNKKHIMSISDLLNEDLEEEDSDDEFSAPEDEEVDLEDEEDSDGSEEELEISQFDENDDESEEEEQDESDQEEEEEEEEEMDIDIKSKSPQTDLSSSKDKKSKKLLTPTTLNTNTPKSEKKKATTPLSLSTNDKENYKHQDTPKPPPKKTPLKDHPDSGKKGAKFVRKGGISCEELAIGSGAEAKPGNMISVYYEGRLRKSGKIFDKQLSGQPFQFRLGKSEVIQGWEVGVEGMKVGGKRRLCIPPHMAYGKRGSPPEIPPHSALVFEIELKDSRK